MFKLECVDIILCSYKFGIPMLFDVSGVIQDVINTHFRY